MSGFGTRFRLAGEFWKMSSGQGGDRLAMALETEAGLQFVGDELEIGWLRAASRANGRRLRAWR